MIDYAAQQANCLAVTIEKQRLCPFGRVAIDLDAQVITASIDDLPFVFEIGNDDDKNVAVHGDGVIAAALRD